MPKNNIGRNAKNSGRGCRFNFFIERNIKFFMATNKIQEKETELYLGTIVIDSRCKIINRPKSTKQNSAYQISHAICEHIIWPHIICQHIVWQQIRRQNCKFYYRKN